MYVVFFDDETLRTQLLPLTYTRPISELRIGILTISEKWNQQLKSESHSHLTADYLQAKFPYQESDNQYFINSSFCPNTNLIEAVSNLELNESLVKDDQIIAFRGALEQFKTASKNNKNFPFDVRQISRPWQIFQHNGEQIEADFEVLTKNRTSAKLSETNQIIGAEHIFVEEGAKVECAILNATSGPIYIGKNAEVMEGAIVRGPFALCESSTLKLGAKIYGPTTIGPHSKVGGEVNNSVILGYSNKGHDGFLGNSVLGEWCNIGADSNNSNLKNNYADVRLWDYATQRYPSTDLQFCGLIMGDHSKCGINTMFNTGTVIGVSANIFGAGFPRNFVPSFSWGGASGYSEYKLNKVFEVAEKVMERRGLELNTVEKEILETVFERSKVFRKAY
ncbi:MAG: GlmU family protein [Flavobacteriales bacterium]